MTLDPSPGAARPLFDDGERANRSQKGHLEGSFEFYDRAGTPFWAELRRVLNLWFAHYPPEHREELRRSLTSSNDRASEAALWELLLHELYHGAGFAAEVHPTLPGTTKRPDFLMSRDATALILEARVVTGESDEEYLRDRRRRAIYDVVDKLRPDDFYVRLEVVRDGEQQPPVARLNEHLEGWLAEQDVDHVEKRMLATSDLRAMPSTDFEFGGWHLRFWVIPVRAERRRRLTGPMLGILPVSTWVGDPARMVRRALRHKGRRYGDTPLPLVIALAIESIVVDSEDIASALYGTTVAELDARDPSTIVAQYRKRDGYFAPTRGTRVAAVLTVPTPRPWMAPRLKPHLWINPWATNPYAGDRLWAWTTMDPESGAFDHGAATVAPAELLGLPTDWLSGRAFDD